MSDSPAQHDPPTTPGAATPTPAVPLDYRDATPNEVAPDVSAGTKFFATIGVLIVIVSALAAIVVPVLFVWWLIARV